MRKVDIAQLSDPEVRIVNVPQLHERGLVAGAPPTLAARIDAMQVPPTALAPRIEAERTALLAQSPDTLTVRAGAIAVGEVAFRMSEAGSIDVQLSGLLDLVADRMSPEDYSPVRKSEAADRFVLLDDLRAIGLSERDDPVYDDLDLSA